MNWRRLFSISLITGVVMTALLFVLDELLRGDVPDLAFRAITYVVLLAVLVVAVRISASGSGKEKA
ncbi:MAG: hypothetical protein ACYSX0_07655 [Planctomycetota bacterium]|jgi:hypothetical protein